jgi:steroid delta-isomerase-like uncharacterized protein
MSPAPDVPSGHRINPVEETKMSEARALVEAHNRVFNDRDWSRAPEILSPDVRSTAPGVGTLTGIDPFIAFAKGFIVAFPDSRLEVETTTVDGNHVVCEGRYTGTQTGPLMTPQGEVPPSGRALNLPYVDVFDVEAGRIARHRTYYDQVDFALQLGLMPEPAAAS